MRGRSPTFKTIPINMVGSTKFGRYPKISSEATWNMIISDNFLVPYAGHLQRVQIASRSEGRGLYASNRYNHMLAVIGSGVYSISQNLTPTFIHELETSTGDVFIDENNANQIAISDMKNIYIYNYSGTGTVFQKATFASGYIPGYITYQNGRFIASGVGTNQWFLSAPGNGLNWDINMGAYQGALQTKPDFVSAVQRFPGRGNLLHVYGNTVAELWTDIGAQIFPYQRNASVNVDYGCLSPTTIAWNDNVIVWLAINEKSGPMIAYSTGGDIKKISTDGIDFKLAQLANPKNSYGFLFRQDGHLIYQITFQQDNLTYLYDFNTDSFFNASDENMNAHIAKRVVFFNDRYYFISFIDGNLYELSSEFTTYNGKEIPRIRVCPPVRLPDASRFAINNASLTLEQGTQENIFLNENLLTESGLVIETESLEDIQVDESFAFYTYSPLLDENDELLLTEDHQEILAQEEDDRPYPIPQTVSLSISKNGSESFGSYWSKDLNPKGKFKNRLIYWNLGTANDVTTQWRFKGLSRFVVGEGTMDIYQ